MLRTILLIISLLLIGIGFDPFVRAQEKQNTPPIRIENVTSFATAPNARTGAVFFDIHNSGKEDDRLVAASTNVAEKVEIHQTMIDADTGTMMMRRVDAVEVKAGSKATLSPTGDHVMLIGLAEGLQDGQRFPLTLTFEKAGEVPATVTVTPPGGAGETAPSHHHGHE